MSPSEVKASVRLQVYWKCEKEHELKECHVIESLDLNETFLLGDNLERLPFSTILQTHITLNINDPRIKVFADHVDHSVLETICKIRTLTLKYI